MDGPEHIREKALAAIDATHVRARPGPQPHRLDGRHPARLVHQPPARLGRADHRVRREARPASRCAIPAVVDRIVEAFAAEGADAWYSSPPSRFLGNDHNPDDYEQVMRHRRCLVRVRLDPRLRAGGARPALAGRPLSRRLRPASRLVPFLAAGGCRHARRGAVQGGADARLRARRAGPQDVEVAGQRHRAAGGRGQVRRRHPAAVGDDRPTPPRTCASGRRSSSSRPSCIAGCATRCAGCWAASTASPRRKRVPVGRDAGAGALGAAPADRARRDDPRRGGQLRLDRGVSRAAQFLLRRPSAFYFDIRKDAIYCDRPDSLRRRAARTVLDHLHRCLTTWLAPVLCFTAEEAWTARFGEEGSVHLELFPDLAGGLARRGAGRARARSSARSAAASRCRSRRRGRAKTIGASLQAAVTLTLAPDEAELLTEARMGRGRHRVAGCARSRARRRPGGGRRWRPGRNAPAAGGCCRRSDRSPPTRRCACAAPTRSSPAWSAVPPHDPQRPDTGRGGLRPGRAGGRPGQQMVGAARLDLPRSGRSCCCRC